MIKNKSELLKDFPPKEREDRLVLLDIAEKVIENLDPSALVFEELENIKPDKKGDIYVIGAGKGSAKMAEATEKYFGERIKEGFVIIPEESSKPNLKHINYCDASHPLPNENGLKGAEKILEIAKKAKEEDLVIVLISGGGSALMPLPSSGITLEDKIECTEMLLKCGADIKEINALRKHLSAIKGGFLAKAIYPATCEALIISDVRGDDLSVIASGPVSPNPTTQEEVIAILDKYELSEKMPESVRLHLSRTYETPKEGDKIFEKVSTKILANYSSAANEAKKIAEEYNPTVISDNLEGDCNQQAKKVCQEIANKEGLFILTGETTVIVEGNGCGGRNQQFALSFLQEAKQLGLNASIVSIGTDGVDGMCPEKIAGAIASPSTTDSKLEIEDYLKNNDSYHYFKKSRGLIITGPTGTNLGDLILIKK